MPRLNGKFILLISIIFVTACSFLNNLGFSGEDTSETATELEVQAVSTATPIPTPSPEPTLKTELAEPVSPISPISPVSPITPTEQAQMSLSDQSVDPIPGSEEALAAAVEDLINQTGVSANEITLVSIEAVEWGDTSLGCPQEGYMYAQVITPGYNIVLQAQGQQYEYHTDQGTNVILCDQ